MRKVAEGKIYWTQWDSCNKYVQSDLNIISTFHRTEFDTSASRWRWLISSINHIENCNHKREN